MLPVLLHSHPKEFSSMKSPLRRVFAGIFAVASLSIAVAQTSTKPTAEDVVIKNATILTVTHGTIENGSILLRGGKIAEVGKNVNAPANAKVIDATGKLAMPGIIDSHSHVALSNDVNEATAPVT